MDRPTKFEHHRYLGDKRVQVAYDLDELGTEHADLIAELMAAETFICFAPDSASEARNRGYRIFVPGSSAS